MSAKRFVIAFARVKVIILMVPKLLHSVPHEIRSLAVPRTKKEKKEPPECWMVARIARRFHGSMYIKHKASLPL